MRGERFHAEGFGRVMAAEQKIDAEFFGCDGGPVRRLARDERVDPFVRHSINFRTGAAGNKTD